MGEFSSYLSTPEDRTVPTDDDFAHLFARLEAGEPAAAAEVHARYACRLIGLARYGLNSRIRSRMDGDDVAQSVFRTFFRRAAAGAFDLASEDALWALLAEITLRKCGRWNRLFAAAKRDTRREIRLSPEDEESFVVQPIDTREPSPDDAAILVDLVEQVLTALEGRDRLVCELRLQGFTPPEIAQRAGCSEATVFRKLDRIKDTLRRFLPREDL